MRADSEPEAYWRDVGTVDAYWEANIDLTQATPHLDLYDRSWPIWTFQEMTPPAKFVHDLDGRRGHAISSLVAGGCIISGSCVHDSMIFSNVHVHSYSDLKQAVILPRCQIGEHVRLTTVVLDRGVRIPDGMVIGEDPDLDAKRFRRTANGVCLVTQPMIDRLA